VTAQTWNQDSPIKYKIGRDGILYTDHVRPTAWLGFLVYVGWAFEVEDTSRWMYQVFWNPEIHSHPDFEPLGLILNRGNNREYKGYEHILWEFSTNEFFHILNHNGGNLYLRSEPLEDTVLHKYIRNVLRGILS